MAKYTQGATLVESVQKSPCDQKKYSILMDMLLRLSFSFSEQANLDSL